MEIQGKVKSDSDNFQWIMECYKIMGIEIDFPVEFKYLKDYLEKKK